MILTKISTKKGQCFYLSKKADGGNYNQTGEIFQKKQVGRLIGSGFFAFFVKLDNNSKKGKNSISKA